MSFARLVIAQAGLVLHNQAQFPSPGADTGTTSPGCPNRTVTRLPRSTCAPAAGNCSNATPLPINEGISPSREHSSVTPRTDWPARFGTTIALGSPNATVCGAELGAFVFATAA